MQDRVSGGGGLLKYKTAHLGEQSRFDCSQSSESFNQERLSLMHQESHPGYVTEAFTWNQSEKRSQPKITHREEALYKCNRYVKNFSLEGLLMHQVTPTGEPFACSQSDQIGQQEIKRREEIEYRNKCNQEERLVEEESHTKKCLLYTTNQVR